MNNIEKLAIESGFIRIGDEGEEPIFTLTGLLELEAFAKALQSSEPVAEVVHNENQMHVKILKYKPLHHGTKLFTHPHASAPVEDAKVRDLSSRIKSRTFASAPVEDAKVRDLILELKCLGEVLAMEMTTIEGNPIAPVIDDAWQTIERLVATQSASVPLEKYNKLEQQLAELTDAYLLMRTGLNCLSDKAITGNQADILLGSEIPDFINYKERMRDIGSWEKLLTLAKGDWVKQAIAEAEGKEG